MGFLDDIEKKADRFRTDKERQETLERERARRVEELKPSLRQIYRYLLHLAEQLDVAQPEVLVSYKVEGYGTLTDLRQQSYSARADDRENPTEVTLAIECADSNGRERVFYTEGRRAYLRQREYLYTNLLRFDHKIAITGRGTFFLEPHVPVRLICTPDADARKLKLRVINYDRVGSEDTYWISPERVSRESLDRLTGFVLRRLNSLEGLVDPPITDEERERLSRRLRAVREAQRREETRAEVLRKTEEQARQEQERLHPIRRKVRSLLHRED